MEFDDLSSRVIGCAIDVHRMNNSRPKDGIKRVVLCFLRAPRVLRGENKSKRPGRLNTFDGYPFRWLNQFVSSYVGCRTRLSTRTAGTPELP